MSKTAIKINIPGKKPDELTKIGDTILKKHLGLDADSPLNLPDMTTFAKNLTDDTEKRAAVQRLYEEVELLNQQVGLYIGTEKSQNAKTSDTAQSILTSVREILLGLNRARSGN